MSKLFWVVCALAFGAWMFLTGGILGLLIGLVKVAITVTIYEGIFLR